MTMDNRAQTIVQQAVDNAIAKGDEIGMQVVAYHNGKLAVDVWGGLADPKTGRKVDGDTLFSVYSVTKAVVATAIHMMVDRGHLDYDTPIVKWWPEYGAYGKENTTVRHVLTHRACVPQMPAGITVERMCDWDWMTNAIAQLKPLAEPGTKTLYLSMTFGWILGEVLRRADPHQRTTGRFVREEIAQPLKAPDLWIGLPDEATPRFARHTNAMYPVPPQFSSAMWRTMTALSKVIPENLFAGMMKLPPLFLASMPFAVSLVPDVFERPDVRRAEIGGVGGIFSARSEARFWAMLANGGELDGVRLLSGELVSTLNTPRSESDEKDPVMFDMPLPLSIGGYWLGGGAPPVASAQSPRALCHPGQGGSIGWADPDQNLAVAICHNRMFNALELENDPVFPISQAVRKALDISAD